MSFAVLQSIASLGAHVVSTGQKANLVQIARSSCSAVPTKLGLNIYILIYTYTYVRIYIYIHIVFPLQNTRVMLWSPGQFVTWRSGELPHLAVLDVQVSIIQSISSTKAQQVPGILWEAGGGCGAFWDATVQNLGFRMHRTVRTSNCVWRCLRISATLSSEM